jgi:uncharacterized membrane protein YdjX (TVP38/TMEM64 family)
LEYPQENLWPEGIKADFEDVDVGISLTQPAFGEIQETRQVESLYRDAILTAHHYIYIENQYFTSNAIGEALIQKLEEKNGPEVLLVLPKKTIGWLEQNTMDVLRYRLLKRVRTADRYGKLRVFYPALPGKGNEFLNVHAKVLIVDDLFIRVGSSNLSNHSMGLDTECDLAIEGVESKRLQTGIIGVRNRLLGGHLGVDPEKVRQVFETKGSLISTIESLQGNSRTFHHLNEQVPDTIDREIPDSAVIDPERPIEPEGLVNFFIPKEQIKPASRLGLRFAFLLSFILALGAAWIWTPLGNLINGEQIAQWLEMVHQTRFVYIVVPGLFMLASVIGIPITFLMVGTLLVFGTFEGFLYSWVGCLIGSAVSYQVGHFMGRDLFRKFGGKKINQLSQWFARRGIIAVATVRIVPVAPFTVINMVAGASHIRFSDYMLGTLIGLTPGLMALAIGVDRIIYAVRNPSPMTFAILGMVIVVIGFAAWGVRSWALKKREEKV